MTWKKWMANSLKFLVFLGIGLAILFLVYRSQNAAFQEDCALRGVAAEDCSLLRKVAGDFASVRYGWIVLVLLAFTLSNISRALRWNMLLRPLGYRPRLLNSYLTILLGYFANLGLPRLGEVVRAGTIAQYEQMAVEKVMGTIVVDRIFDVVSILLVTLLVAVLEFDTIAGFVNQYVDLESRFGGLSSLLAYGVIAMLIVAVLFGAFRRRIVRTALYGKVAAIALGFRDGLLSIRRLDRPWLFIFHSVNIWVMFYLMTYLCFFSFAPTAHLSPLVALVVFVFGGWGIVIPSPGGMGTYHFLVQTALQMYGINGNDAFSLANIAFFSIQLGGNILFGILALLLLPIVNRDYHPQPAASPA